LAIVGLTLVVIGTLVVTVDPKAIVVAAVVLIGLVTVIGSVCRQWTVELWWFVVSSGMDNGDDDFVPW